MQASRTKARGELPRLLKSEVLQHFTASELGRLLKVSHQAIYRWAQHVPEHHVKKLLRKHPDWREREKPVFFNQFNKRPRGQRRASAGK